MAGLVGVVELAQLEGSLVQTVLEGLDLSRYLGPTVWRCRYIKRSIGGW